MASRAGGFHTYQSRVPGHLLRVYISRHSPHLKPHLHLHQPSRRILPGHLDLHTATYTRQTRPLQLHPTQRDAEQGHQPTRHNTLRPPQCAGSTSTTTQTAPSAPTTPPTAASPSAPATSATRPPTSTTTPQPPFRSPPLASATRPPRASRRAPPHTWAPLRARASPPARPPRPTWAPPRRPRHSPAPTRTPPRARGGGARAQSTLTSTGSACASRRRAGRSGPSSCRTRPPPARRPAATPSRARRRPRPLPR